jgi:hypothetical protein
MPKKEWTQAELVKAIADFHEALVYIDHNYLTWKNTVHECDQAFGDIRHYCELSYPNDRSKRTKICRLMRDYGVKRRMYKDLLLVLDPILEISMKLKNDGIYQAANTVRKLNDKTQAGNREYKPRVIQIEEI